MQARTEPTPASRRTLILAAIALLVVDRIVPFGRFVLYPLTLLATWVHEMGHGLTGILVGGRFTRLDIFADASGLAYTDVARGWRQGLVAAGGLLAPPLVGALTLALVRGPRRARLFLFLLSAALIGSLAIWVRTPTGLIAMPLVAALTGAVAWGATPRARLFTSQLLGLCLALDTVTRIDYLFEPTVRIGRVNLQSDIAGVAQAFGANYLVWGVLIAAVSLALVAGGLALGLRGDPQPKSH